jgi:small-conductance mechanosensitive channel
MGTSRSVWLQVHDNVSLIVFLALIAAPLVFARAFGRDDRWRPLRAHSVVTGVLGFALLVLYVIASAGTWNGLAQRLFVSVLFVWIAVVGFRLFRLSLDPWIGSG